MKMSLLSSVVWSLIMSAVVVQYTFKDSRNKIQEKIVWFPTFLEANNYAKTLKHSVFLIGKPVIEEKL